MDIVRQAQAEFKHFCVASDGKKFKAIYLCQLYLCMCGVLSSSANLRLD